MTVLELLQTTGRITDELIKREVVRTRNKPLGDYTEWLVCKQLELQIQQNSKAGYDATATDGTKYQIKGRQSDEKKIQFSVIRNLDLQEFDFVIAIAFNPDFSIRFAAEIPHNLIAELATFREHVNGYVLTLGDDCLERDGVEDIGDRLGGEPPA